MKIRKSTVYLFLVTFIFQVIVYFKISSDAVKARADGVRIHQKLIINLMLDPKMFIENLKQVPPEVLEVIEESPELYRMTRFYDEWKDSLKEQTNKNREI